MKKLLAEEKGAVEILEGAHAFPITMLVLLLLLVMIFFLWESVYGEARIRQEMIHDDTEQKISEWRDIFLEKKITVTESSSLFFSTRELRWESKVKPMYPMRFWKIQGDPENRIRRARQTDPAANLWKALTIQGIDIRSERKEES